MVKKAELHVHLEGTATPTLIKRLADRNRVKLPPNLFTAENAFAWSNFIEFLHCYETACQAIRAVQDYYDITFDYLQRCANEQAIYVEMMYSPVHAEQNSGIPSSEYLVAIQAAIDDAKLKFGIISGIIITGVRHYGVDSVIKVAKEAANRHHPCVIGFGLAGEEKAYPPGNFKRAFEIADGSGLPCTVHAGEVAGAASVRQAINCLPVQRIGHGVRAIEDRELLKELVDRDIVLEVCPTSNIAIKVFDSYQQHPFRELYQANIKLTLNSDDPAYFNTSLGKEYGVAQQYFGFSDQQLITFTKNAIEAGFIDAITKQDLLHQLASK